MPTLLEAKDVVRTLSLKALAITEDTSMTAAEQKTALDKIEPEIKTATEEVQALSYVDNKRKEFQAATGQDVANAAAEQAAANVNKSIGHQFIESQGYKGLMNRGLKGGNWTTGDVEVKTAFTEGTAGSPGPGYAPATALPQLLPGVVDIRFQELMIADLFPQGTTDSALIRYLIETLVTNGAGAVAEGALYGESAIKFDKVDETLHKIPTFLPISDEMLEDWAQALSYINARLQLFVRQAEEVQILTGDGTGANMVGLLNRSGLATSIAKGTTPSASDDNSMDAIYRQITQIRMTAFLEPDAMAIEPLAWQNITLSKNSQGAYYANGPFVGQQPATLWGKKVAVTGAIAAHTALVGAFQQGGQIFRKGGLTLEASNSHADFFQRGMTALRAEERLALAIYRPGAFGTVTAL